MGYDPRGQPTRRPATWRRDASTAPFTCLGRGMDGDLFVPHNTWDLVRVSSRFKRTVLRQLAPHHWWGNPKSHEDYRVLRSWLWLASHEVGGFERKRIRGRGVWLEDEGVLLHLGDRLLSNGESVAPQTQTYRGGGRDRPIYHTMPALEGPGSALDVQASRRILKSFTGLSWQHPLHGYLLAGWTALAPISGALEVRPPVWFVGAEEDRLLVLERLVRPLLGHMAQMFEEATAEEVRRHIGADALPVIYNASPLAREIDAVAAFARSSTRERVDLVTGGPEFKFRALFLLSSEHGLGDTRFHLIKLLGPVADLEQLDGDLGRRLLARMVECLEDGRLERTLKACQSACRDVFCGAGMAYWFGVLIAGAWLLKGDEPPTSMSVRAWLESFDLQGLTSFSFAGTDVLQLLFRRRVYVGDKRPRIGDLIETALGTISPDYPDISHTDAHHALRPKGIRVGDDGPAVLIANGSKWVAEKLAGTEYEDSWRRDLKQLPGARPTRNSKRFGSYTSRAVRVPLDGLGLVRV